LGSRLNHEPQNTTWQLIETMPCDLQQNTWLFNHAYPRQRLMNFLNVGYT